MQTTETAFRPMPRQLVIAREGFPFIGIALICMFVLWMSGFGVGAGIAFFVAVFIAYFFRNPERKISEDPSAVVSPADGRIIKIESGVNAPHTETRSIRVSIFMSVLNVHINRFPVSARVKKIVYNAGKFFVASLDKASEQNERNAIVMEDDKGREFVMVQIAGLIARRIVCYVREGDYIPRGSRFGLIRFGSRVDLYLPENSQVIAKIGDRVFGGESILAKL